MKNAESPTVTNELVFITVAIEAHERKNAVMLDTPRVYLHTDMDEEVVMLLKGRLAELMVQVDSKHIGNM